MKKVLAAGIVRVLRFSSIQEMYTYIGKFRKKKIPCHCFWHIENPDGSVILNLITGYNDTPLYGVDAEIKVLWDDQEGNRHQLIFNNPENAQIEVESLKSKFDYVEVEGV